MGKLDMNFYLATIRHRYRKATKREKSKILDELCANSGFHRKHAIRLINQGNRYAKKRSGRPCSYNITALLPHLKMLWLATNKMCGKRLIQAMPLWLPHYNASDDIKKILLAMSAATADRLLEQTKVSYLRGRCGTKPGSLLRNEIPILTNQWNSAEPGFVEADTVAHCGNSLQGEFIWSLTLTDISSGWTENRALWTKEVKGLLKAIQSIETVLPFFLKGFDCDNGSEFLNYELLRYFQSEDKLVQFTRSRPYHKNDNAHVEQKNWTHVRQLFGYDRFDQPEILALMNDLYSNELSDLQNFFYPTHKLKNKQRVNAKIKKQYGPLLTPYQRLLTFPQVDPLIKQRLEQRFSKLNPFELNKRIKEKMDEIFNLILVASHLRQRR